MGVCTCNAQTQCDYCVEMTLWADELLYGPEDDCSLFEDEREWEEDDPAETWR